MFRVRSTRTCSWGHFRFRVVINVNSLRLRKVLRPGFTPTVIPNWALLAIAVLSVMDPVNRRARGRSLNSAVCFVEFGAPRRAHSAVLGQKACRSPATKSTPTVPEPRPLVPRVPLSSCTHQKTQLPPVRMIRVVQLSVQALNRFRLPAQRFASPSAQLGLGVLDVDRAYSFHISTSTLLKPMVNEGQASNSRVIPPLLSVRSREHCSDPHPNSRSSLAPRARAISSKPVR
jgi:hypothetical protein